MFITGIKKLPKIFLISLIVLGFISGCSSNQFNSRHMQGEVLAMPPSQDTSAPDLLITNWDVSADADTFFVTYITDTIQGNKARSEAWEKELPQYNSWYNPKATFDNKSVYYNIATRLLALDRVTGVAAWEVALSDLVNSSCTECLQKVGDQVVVMTTDYTLHGINAAKGNITWSERLNHSSAAYDGFSTINNLIVYLDHVSVDSSDWAVKIISPSNGDLIRQISPTCPDPNSRPSFAHDEVAFDLPASRGTRVVFLYDCFGDSYVQSWDLVTGMLVWQVPLPEQLSSSYEIFKPGPDRLILESHEDYYTLNLDLGRIEPLRLDLDPDYNWTPLAEYEDILIGTAERTRGTKTHELWAFGNSGDLVWRFLMQAETLDGVDTGIIDATYQMTQDGLTLIQFIEDPDRVFITVLDPTTGEEIHKESNKIERAYLTSATWDRNYAFLNISGKLYSLDLKTLEFTQEWP